MENLIHLDSDFSFLFIVLFDTFYSSNRNKLTINICMHSINNISLYSPLYFSFSYVPFESTVNVMQTFIITHSLNCSFPFLSFLFFFFLIQRPIDTYCNRFVVGHRHSFSLPSKQENRIKEKKRKEKKRNEWPMTIFNFLALSLLFVSIL